MALELELSKGERWRGVRAGARSLLLKACVQAAVVVLIIGVLAHQAQLARRHFLIHPLEAAINAVGIAGVPEVQAIAWTTYQPVAPPTFDELRNRAGRVLRAWAPGYRAAAHSSVENGVSIVRYRGTGPGGQSFEIRVQHSHLVSEGQLLGPVTVALRVQGRLEQGLRDVDYRMRSAVRRGGATPWSAVETWVTLSGNAAMTTEGEALERIVAAAGVGKAVVRSEGGNAFLGLSQRLSPAWRLGERLVNVEIRFGRSVGSGGANRRVQVGTPFVTDSDLFSQMTSRINSTNSSS